MTISSKGAKSAALLSASGKAVALRRPELRAPFGATAWDDPEAVRRNLDLTDLPASVLDWFQKLDEWVIAYVTKNSARLFKSAKSEAEVRHMYTSLVKPGKSDWPPTLRAKVNLSGPGAIRVWEKTGEGELQRRKMPEEWRNAKMEAVGTLSSLWIQAKFFGLVFTLTDAVVQEVAEAECPF